MVEIEEMLEVMDEAIAKIQALNTDNITEDDNFEELRKYLIEHGFSEEEVEKVIEGLQELGVDELYTSPYFNFYEEYDVKPTTDPRELLIELASAYDSWADVEEEAAWECGEECTTTSLRDYAQDFYELKEEGVLFETSYLDARLNKHYHTIRYEVYSNEWTFIIYEKSGVGHGIKKRQASLDDIEELRETLAELQEKADNAETTDELIDIIEKAIEAAGFEDGRITWAETW